LLLTHFLSCCRPACCSNSFDISYRGHIGVDEKIVVLVVQESIITLSHTLFSLLLLSFQEINDPLLDFALPVVLGPVWDNIVDKMANFSELQPPLRTRKKRTKRSSRLSNHALVLLFPGLLEQGSPCCSLKHLADTLVGLGRALQVLGSLDVVGNGLPLRALLA